MGSCGGSRPGPAPWAEAVGAKEYRPALGPPTGRGQPEYMAMSPQAPESTALAGRSAAAHLLRHAALAWAVLPCLIVLAALHGPAALRPTCASGFGDATWLAIALVEAHHLRAEDAAWLAVRGTLAGPEVAIMRQLGILRWRSLKVALGVVESLDFYTDLTFPFIVRACGQAFDDTWARSWHDVPLLGPLCARVFGGLTFWGTALLVVVLKVAVTLAVGAASVALDARRPMRRRPRAAERSPRGMSAPTRVSGERFIAWANAAQVAMMPSVTMFCEAMAEQRKYAHDFSKDAKLSTQARTELVFGRLNVSRAESMQMGDREEEEAVSGAERWHFTVLLFNIFFGSVLLMWLQASFLEHGFSVLGDEAKWKVCVSVALSAAIALARGCQAARRLGSRGFTMCGLIVLFVAWAGAKVHFAYACPNHVWNLSTFNCASRGGLA